MTTNDTDRLARHRRALRAATGLSQAEVVERAKAEGYSLSLDTLTSAEAGRAVTERSLRAICLGLGCKLGDYMQAGTPIIAD